MKNAQDTQLPPSSEPVTPSANQSPSKDNTPRTIDLGLRDITLIKGRYLDLAYLLRETLCNNSSN